MLPPWSSSLFRFPPLLFGVGGSWLPGTTGDTRPFGGFAPPEVCCFSNGTCCDCFVALLILWFLDILSLVTPASNNAGHVPSITDFWYAFQKAHFSFDTH